MLIVLVCLPVLIHFAPAGKGGRPNMSQTAAHCRFCYSIPKNTLRKQPSQSNRTGPGFELYSQFESKFR